ncbi:MAG: hypothetical protein KDD78_13955, partial [Caldilineaceae bacterium]|nr:hypothetical protein [Caldilineaceae bacterium]
MQKRIVWLAVLMMTVLLMAACSAPAAPAESSADAPAEGVAAEDGPITVRLSLGAEPPTLDPNLAQDTYAIQSMEGMFLGLTNINNVTEEIEPELATDWTISDDGTVWTFTMRQDAVWSDGQPVTAHDVEYSVKRAVMPETASPYAYVLYI